MRSLILHLRSYSIIGLILALSIAISSCGKSGGAKSGSSGGATDKTAVTNSTSSGFTIAAVAGASSGGSTDFQFTSTNRISKVIISDSVSGKAPVSTASFKLSGAAYAF